MMLSEGSADTFKDQEAISLWAWIWRQLDPTSPEFAALQAVAHGMLFLFAPPDAFFGEPGQIVATKKELHQHQQRSQSYIASLSPWVKDTLTRATDEQRWCLHLIGLSAEPASEPTSARAERPEERPPAPPPAETFPDPTDAVLMLESLAQRFDRSTLEQLGIELAVETLRFILASGQRDAFRAYLEEVHQPVPPEKLARYGIRPY